MIGLGLRLGLYRRSMGGGVSIAALTAALAADAGVTDFAIYDPSDKTSMFTTDTGTTQVANDGDTVGLWLDKSQMGGQTAAAFATSQDEFIAGAWTQTVGSGTISGTATSVAFASAASGDKATSASTPTADNWYRYDITVSGLSGAILLKDNTTTVATISSNGTYTYHHKSASTVIGLEASGTTSATITISAKHIPGHHFSQATAASRPVWHDTSGAAPYWVEGDGTDDWLPTNPLFDLGETWAHVGAWRSDTNDRGFFATSDDVALRGRFSDFGGRWAATNSASSFPSYLTTSDPAAIHTITIERTAASLTARFNGASEVASFVPWDGSSTTEGVGLFSRRNNVASNTLDGRAYFLMFAKLSAPLQTATRTLAEQVAEASTGEALL